MIGRRFELRRRLGQGGMGAVYLAFDRLEQREVALKRWLLAGDAGLEGATENTTEMLLIAHEFRLLAGLRHPNIISVYDFGFDETGQPFFTMEPLATPFSLLEASRRQTLAEQSVHWLEVLSALTYLHRHDVIHRDLKPGNILVAEGRARVLDFGIAERDRANRTARSIVTPALAGTLAYLAPELLNGEEAGPAADLWAFGIMLYEAMTGCHPFGGSAAQVMRKILLAEPALDDDRIPPALRPILARLLAKEQTARYQHADQLARDLCAALEVSPPAEAELVLDGYLQKAPLIGREAEQQRAVFCLEQALAGHGRLFFVSGESGVGKSRLFAEIRVLAQVRGFLAVAGRGDADGHAAYALWRRITTLLALLADPTDAEAAALRTVVPDLDVYLARPLPAMPALDPQGEQELLFATFRALLGRVEVPLLWVLDDLQWADGASRALLAHLAPQLGDLRLLILASSRGEKLEGVEVHETVRLPRLNHEQIALFAGSVLGAAPPGSLIDHLIRETEGNPFFLVEILRASAEAAGRLDDVGRADAGTVESLRIREALEQRLALVPERARALLEIAALAGRRIDLAWLAAVEPEADLEAFLRAAAPVLEADGLSWQFGHDRLRDALVQRQAPGERRQRHARLAAALEGLEAPDKVAALAHHWQAAVEPGDPDSVLRAVAALERHGAGLLNVATPEAFEHLEKALAFLVHLPEGRHRLELEARLLESLAASLFERRQLAESAVPCQRLLAIGHQLGDEQMQAAGYFGVWRRHHYGGHLRQARAAADDFQRFAAGAVASGPRLLAAGALGVTRYYQGSTEAAATLQTAVDLYEDSPEPLRRKFANARLSFHPVVNAALHASYSWTKVGRTKPAQAAAELVRALALAGDHVPTRCIRWLSVLVLHSFRQEPQAVREQVEEFRRAEALVPEYWRRVVGVVADWAAIRLGGDRLAELRQSVAWLRRFGLAISVPYYVNLQCEGELLLGRVDAAGALIAEMLEGLEASGSHVWRGELLRLRAMALKSRGENDEAAVAFQLAIDAAGTWPDAVAGQRAAWEMWQLQKNPDTRRQLEQATAGLDSGFDYPELSAARRLLGIERIH